MSNPNMKSDPNMCLHSDNCNDVCQCDKYITGLVVCFS